ncbi:MAG: 4-hydroxythreonine-4-phosphate dehydrogenase PdxA [Myxococcota bacterium]
MTLGDPAGIGPDVVSKALEARPDESHTADWVVFGPDAIAERIAGAHRVSCVKLPAFHGARGGPSAASGEASLQALMGAIEAAKSGEVDAICTAPISKEALAMAGSADRGHTEILARELGDGPTAMSFFGERLRAVLVTTHMPLRDAIAALDEERILECARLLDQALRGPLGVSQPRVALAALNPHAGEAGLLGSEEIELLAPAVVRARGEGLDVHGPLPADAVFRQALDGEFDGVIALYHDQALIPLKLLGFGETTNVTLGLRVPRTSPDHGTAYDRVGTDAIRADGMIAALDWALRLATPGSA